MVKSIQINLLRLLILIRSSHVEIQQIQDRIIFYCISMQNQETSTKIKQFKYGKLTPISIQFRAIKVIAQIKNQQSQLQYNTILKPATGILTPKTFTAILGPSGSGKTTLLNLLSGKLVSPNLTITGQIRLNGSKIQSMNDYSKYFGYVTQQDLLLPTFTPRQAFTFVAEMRMHWLSEKEIEEKVNQIILQLGLTNCADTYIGNNIIRGISGGQKKRTSIGVQLLTNPSVLFLDQPTTGLDSTTAFNIMTYIKTMVNDGRTIISTIHQPSSELYNQFDQTMLMVDGNIVYHGDNKKAIDYFHQAGFTIPRFTNPADYFMKIFNLQGSGNINLPEHQMKAAFDERIKKLVDFYQKKHEKYPAPQKTELKTEEIESCPFCTSSKLLFIRTLKSQYRNPLDLRIRLLTMIIQGIVCVILYYQQSDKPEGQMQNIIGAIFFMVMTIGFQGTITNISTFTAQRSIFIKERMANTYGCFSYYFARTMAYLPIQFLMVFVFLVISFFACNLNDTASKFFTFYAILIAQYFASSGYGIMISTVVPDLELAFSLVPVLLVPFMLIAGFFSSSVPIGLIWLQALSYFKYALDAGLTNQYTDPSVSVKCQFNDIERNCDILQKNYDIWVDLWYNVLILFGLGFILRIIGFIGLYVMSNPKYLKLKEQRSTMINESQQQVR